MRDFAQTEKKHILSPSFFLCDNFKEVLLPINKKTNPPRQMNMGPAKLSLSHFLENERGMGMETERKSKRERDKEWEWERERERERGKGKGKEKGNGKG